MRVTEREKSIYGENVEILLREEDCTVYRRTDDDGEAVMIAYAVFPGIELVYHDIHAQSCRLRAMDVENIIEIHHCREGRYECEYGENFCYLTPGDLAVVRKRDASSSAFYPLSHYHGVSVILDLDHAPRCLSCFLKDVTVSPHSLAEKFCTDRSCFIARSDAGIGHIFSELYNVPESIRRGYFKVKVLELLLFLSALDTDRDELEERSCSRAHVLLAKEVGAYLTDHMTDRITLEQLCVRFHVSGTHIKNSFKSVYGVSVYTYIRTQKMQAAARMLIRTERTILEIAGQFGYDNGSKFAGAFRDVMGMSPGEYRRYGADNMTGK